MVWSHVRWCLAGSLAIAALGFAREARAEGEACVRDTECVGAELCENAACGVSETPPPSCEDGCAPLFEVCDEGFCKGEGVVCDNPAGRCWYEGTSVVDGAVDEGHTQCDCADGSSSGGTPGYNPDDPPEPPPDEELLVTCEQMLESLCGTEAPTLPDSCQGDVLTGCEALIAIEEVARIDCGYDPLEVTIARVGECCDSYDEVAAAEYRDCMLAKTEPTCGDLEACSPNTDGGDTDGEGAVTDGSTDPTGAGTGGDDQPTQDSDEASGCSVGGSGSGWMLALAGIVAFRRRRWAR